MTTFDTISISKAQKLMQEGANIVDIRDHASYQTGHIEGATHLNNNNLQDFVETVDLDKPLIVYCYHGHSSQTAAQFLINQGFETVYSMRGGYAAWFAELKGRQS
ncbi:MAG: thiosulfate sulfurtransferase GlpE [Cellvibrionaceae bacterium]|nr:thiosulfate sulfurtransferase GlpE [Cellvibrionaceae bacterium]